MKQLVAQMDDHELEEAIISKEEKLREIFPIEWTVPSLENIGVKAMFHFKLHGLDWRNEAEFTRICVAMHKLRILELSPDKKMIRRAPHIVNLH
jgi:hypothetical protein